MDAIDQSESILCEDEPTTSQGAESHAPEPELKPPKPNPSNPTIRLLDCLRCGYQWKSRHGSPLQCALCRSAYWNVPPRNIADQMEVLTSRSRARAAATARKAAQQRTRDIETMKALARGIGRDSIAIITKLFKTGDELGAAIAPGAPLAPVAPLSPIPVNGSAIAGVGLPPPPKFEDAQ
jgi:hypothetical protein